MHSIPLTARRVWCALLFLVLATAVPAHAQDREWKRLSEFMEITRMDKFLSVPPAQRDKIRLLGTMTPANKTIKPSDVVYTIVHAKGKERIQVDADGHFDLLPAARYMTEDPMVFVNMPPGEKAAYGFAVEPLIPSGPHMPYTDLIGSLKQYETVVKAKAGIFSFVFPKFNAVVLRFAKPAQQTLKILSKEGTQTLAADSQGVITVRLDDKLLAENPGVQLSESFVSTDFAKL